jgi:hypothetical protein
MKRFSEPPFGNKLNVLPHIDVQRAGSLTWGGGISFTLFEYLRYDDIELFHKREMLRCQIPSLLTHNSGDACKNTGDSVSEPLRDTLGRISGSPAKLFCLIL